MAVKKKISELPPVTNIDNYEVVGWDKSSNQSARANMNQLRGNVGATPNISIQAGSVAYGQPPSVTKSGNTLNPVFLIRFPLAKDGEIAAIRNSGGYLQYKYPSQSTWTNIISIDELKLKFSDLTDEDIADLQRPAVDAAAALDEYIITKEAVFDTLQAETEAARDSAQDTADHPAIVGEDYYVYEWNKEAKAYNKTEIYLKGDSFDVKEVYSSVLKMNQDVNNPAIRVGDFVLINTDNVEVTDNAKLYVKRKADNGTFYYQFLVDMSGAIGFTGKTPQYSIGTVSKTAPGSNPVVTISANGSDVSGNPQFKLNFSFPTGETGPAPVIEIGTITTGAPGSAATATLVPNGVASNGANKYLLNMSLPQGLPGSGAGNVLVSTEGLLAGKMYLFQPNANGSAAGTFVEYNPVDITTVSLTFTQAESRVNINSGETLPIMFGKIRKWLIDLKALAFKDKIDYTVDIDNAPILSEVATSGAYSDLTGKPSIPSKTSDITNDSNYQTGANVDNKIGTHNANATAHSDIRGNVSALQSGVTSINEKIPSAASTMNQLADKEFVNSSIANMAANYVTYDAAGNAFATKAALLSATTFYHGGIKYTPSEHDYVTVLADETHSSECWRYTYTGTMWSAQYRVNEAPMAQAQLSALNSGITVEKVASYDNLLTYPKHKTAAILPENWQLFEDHYRVQVTDADITANNVVIAWPADDASSDIAQAAKIRENMQVAGGYFYVRAQSQPTDNMNINYTIQA